MNQIKLLLQHHITLKNVLTSGEISDIDSCDDNDQLPVLEYAEELFEFYRKIEVSVCLFHFNYMNKIVSCV